MNKTAQIMESVAVSGAFHIENIYPLIDSGRFPVKRIVGEPIEVWADIYRDGVDIMAAAIVWRLETARAWTRAAMSHDADDRWTGTFTPDAPGRYVIAIEAWTDEFTTWRRGFDQKFQTGQDIDLDALEGAALLTKAHAGGPEASALIIRHCEDYLKTGHIAPLLAPELHDAMAESQLRSDLTRSPLMPLIIDRVRARDGAWYQMTPRSQGKTPGQPGTFRDCIERLPDIAAMGFDVVCLTPIHPINGRNGGHDAIDPELGTMEDFQAFVEACHSLQMEVALDIAARCSPDHPWLTEHPDWFKHRPDGAMAYAGNPPRKYEGTIAPDFTCEDAGSLWNALRDMILFWVDHGVKIFGISDPHATPLRFWEWMIREVQMRHPDVLFLAEAFTRPKLMKGLAKLGFSQNYTYFTWQTQKREIEYYLNQLTAYPERDFYRPNFFVNTPDILPYHLQGGEAWMFKARLALAASLSSTYGIYNGFELLEHEAIPGTEEHLNSDTREIKVRDWDQPGNIKAYIRDINRARRNNPALQQTSSLRFVPIDNENVIGFVKDSVDRSNTIAVAISLSHEPHEFWLPINAQVMIDGQRRDIAAVENIFTGERHPVEWGGLRVRIDPMCDPALFFRCLA